MMHKMMQLFSRFVLAVGLIALVFGVSPAPALAYGNTAIWQLGISANCNNPALCGDHLGGFWGWAEFDQGGLGDATLAGCGHLVAAGPIHVAGADSFAVDITGWKIDAGSAGPKTFIITSGSITFNGKGGRVTVPLFGDLDTGWPAIAGHYNTTDMLGFSAPGVAFQVQVVQIPNR